MKKALLMAQHRALFPDNKFRSIGSEYYEWKIYKNPFMEGAIYLETIDGKVVGSSTAATKKIAILNEEFLAAELGDSFTLPEYRKQGINTKALKYCTEYAISNGKVGLWRTRNSCKLQITSESRLITMFLYKLYFVD